MQRKYAVINGSRHMSVHEDGLAKNREKHIITMSQKPLIDFFKY